LYYRFISVQHKDTKFEISSFGESLARFAGSVLLLVNIQENKVHSKNIRFGHLFRKTSKYLKKTSQEVRLVTASSGQKTKADISLSQKINI